MSSQTKSFQGSSHLVSEYSKNPIVSLLELSIHDRAGNQEFLEFAIKFLCTKPLVRNLVSVSSSENKEIGLRPSS